MDSASGPTNDSTNQRVARLAGRAVGAALCLALILGILAVGFVYWGLSAIGDNTSIWDDEGETETTVQWPDDED